MEAYTQRGLKYGFNELEPYMSEAQLRLHYEKHHAAYIKNANTLLEKLDSARRPGGEIDMKSTLKSLSFNMAGHILHSLFWESMTPPAKAKKAPLGETAKMINRDFGSFERFKKEFSDAANSVEGSGWAVLSYDWQAKRLVIQQIEKHNVNVVPSLYVLLVLDVWEHAYYVDYKNDRAKFVDGFWGVVNWDEVETRRAKMC